MRTALIIGMIVLLIAALAFIVHSLTAATPSGPAPADNKVLPPGVPGSGDPSAKPTAAPKLP